MAWTEVTDTAQITRLHRVLNERLLSRTKSGGERVIGWPRGSFNASVRLADVSAKKQMWIYSGRHEKTRDYITLVGRHAQDQRNGLLIDLQFNFPSGRFDRRKGGAFVVDSEGQAWLAHRGIVTRGTSRLNRDDVLRNLNWRKPVTATSEKRPSQVELLLVAKLEADDLVERVLRFAVSMRDAATLVAAEQPSKSTRKVVAKGTSGQKAAGNGTRVANKLDAALWQYRDEFSGTRVVTRNGVVVVDWKHGRVVKALHKAVGGGDGVLQSQAADLVVRKSKSLHLYEVKPSSGSQSIYTAIGQLVFNGASLERQFTGHKVRKFLVLPASRNQKERQDRCKELGFELVTFKKKGEEFVFEGLPQ